jgi:hypothetical protein
LIRGLSLGVGLPREAAASARRGRAPFCRMATLVPSERRVVYEANHDNVVNGS